MNKSKVWQLLAVCVASLATPLLVNAQQAAQQAAQQTAQQPAKTVAPPPPELQKLEEGEAPAVTIRKPGEGPNDITQKSEQGRVTEIKVKSGASTYYVKPQSTAGTLQPGDGPVRGAQWQVKEFDLGRKQRKEGEAAQADSDAGLPPPAAATPKN